VYFLHNQVVSRISRVDQWCLVEILQYTVGLWSKYNKIYENAVISSGFLPRVHWIAQDICWNPAHVEHILNAGQQFIYK
jgi:hypothetical protein